MDMKKYTIKLHTDPVVVEVRELEGRLVPRLAYPGTLGGSFIPKQTLNNPEPDVLCGILRDWLQKWVDEALKMQLKTHQQSEE
jgi:hypothetical protein